MGHDSADQGLTEHRHTGLALLLICAVQMMVILDGTIVNIALPSIQHQLHFSAPGLEWVITAYALTFGGLLLLGGRSGDLFGRRRMFTIGVIIFTAASLLGIRHRPGLWLIGARVAQGVGGAIASPTALALIQNTYPRGPLAFTSHGRVRRHVRRGRLVGAPPRWHPDRHRLVALGPVRERPDRGDRRHRRPPCAGHDTHPTGTSRPARCPGGHAGDGVSRLRPVTGGHRQGWSDGFTTGPLAAAAVLLATFVIIESVSPHALMPLHIFADRDRAGSYFMMLALAASMFATLLLHHAISSRTSWGYSPLKAGFAFLPMTIGIGGIGQPDLAPRGQDRHAPAHDRGPPSGVGRPAVAVIRRRARRVHLDRRALGHDRRRHGIHVRPPHLDGHVPGSPR